MGAEMLDSLEADYAPLLLAILGDTSRMDEVIALARDCSQPFLREEALVILMRFGPLPEEVMLPLLVSAADYNRIRRNQARKTLQKSFANPDNLRQAMSLAQQRNMTTLADWLNQHISQQP
jgi:hypothetical protein